MLLTCMKAENMKLKRSFIWIAFFIIPVIPAFMGTGNYLQNIDILKSEWFSLWTQHTLFYSNFFYAPLIGVYCAYIWRVENFNHNRNSLMTVPVPVWCIFLAKMLNIFRVTLLTQLWVGILYIICGKVAGLSGLPDAVVIYWLFRGAWGGMAVAALVLFLSMLIRSFAVPVGFALLGGITGLLVSNEGLGMCYPFSLMMMGMNSNKYEDVLSGAGIQFFLCSAMYIVVFCVLGIYWLSARDVKA